MCFVLYAGTNNPLPRKEWEKDMIGLSVESLTDVDAPIKAHFTNPEVQYVGSTSNCGCDFPHAILQGGGWPEIDFAEDLSQESTRVLRRNQQALFDLLQASGERVVELYGVWDGDYAGLPESKETIPIDTILDSKFRFKERGFYSVVVREGN